MSWSSRISLPLPEAMLPNRKPPASLLRPKPRPTRRILLGAGLFMTGGLLGLLVGIGLQPGQPARDVTSVASPRGPVTATPTNAPAAPEPVADPLAANAVRQAQAAEEARLAATVQARVATEARLAELRRELAATGTPRDTFAQRDVPREPVPREPARRESEQREAAFREATQAMRNALPEAPREPAGRREPPPDVALAPGPQPLRLNRQDGYGAPGGAPRVVVHHRTGSAQAIEAAATMVGQLREAGFEAGELRSVGAVPAQRVVRYFHTDDAPTAARLAGRLGRGWAIQDFRSFEPTPAPGLLEVWLPER